MKEELPKNIYSIEKAQEEADKIKELVGSKGENDDYEIAESLLEDTGEIKKTSYQILAKLALEDEK